MLRLNNWVFMYFCLSNTYYKWNWPAKFHETLCPAKPYKILIFITIKFQYVINCFVDQTFAEETTKESKTYYHLL